MSDYDPLADLAAGKGTQPQTTAYDPLSDVASGKPAPTPAQPSWIDTWVNRPLGLAGRATATGVAALPLMAMDSGVAARNLIGDWGRKELGLEPTPDYELPSQEFQDALTQAGFPVPNTPIEKGTSLVESTLAGAKMPMPTAEAEAPSNFQTADDALMARRLQSVKNGMEEGYRVPPATTNPSLGNRAIETVAGKLAVQNEASRINQPITNRLAAEALGLDPEVPITPEALHAVRAQAGSDYNAIANAGPIKLDQNFKGAINGILGRFNATAEEVPSLADKDLSPVAQDLTSKGSLSGKALLGAIRGLRDKADMAFRAGNGSTGSAYRQMASALEDAADRDLTSRGEDQLVSAFRSARQQIAVSHSIEDALNPGTGNIQASKLAAALRRGEPLSGKLKTIAEFASSVPKAMQEPTSSPVSHLNLAGEILGAMGGAGVHGPIGAAVGAAAYPLVRMGSKLYALSPLGQESAIPALENAAGANAAKAIPGVYAGSQE